MSEHIEAKKGEVAETIILPGDPLRAKYIASNFLKNAKQYNNVRGILGYTGEYNGKRISVQGTGMGIPSISIYVNELISYYGVKNLIRVGTMGGIRDDIKVRDVVLAQGSSTDSSVNRNVFGGNIDYSPLADFKLLSLANEIAEKEGKRVKVGNVFSADRFYDDEMDLKKLNQYGILGIEMETTALYTLAAKFNCRALSILTISNHILTGETTTPDERQKTFNDMIEIALKTGTSI